MNTPLQNNTPNYDSMSSSLKERLKKLGRYHRSPGESTLVPSSIDAAKEDSQKCVSLEHVTNSQLPPENYPVVKKRKSNSPSTCESEPPSNKICRNAPAVENSLPSNAKVVTDEQLQNELKTLKDKIAAKEEKVRKLRLVKMYRVKNDLDNLDQLIKKWTKTCQEALSELHEKMPTPSPSMNELLAHLQIDPQMVAYDIEQEEFLE